MPFTRPQSFCCQVLSPCTVLFVALSLTPTLYALLAGKCSIRCETPFGVQLSEQDTSWQVGSPESLGGATPQVGWSRLGHPCNSPTDNVGTDPMLWPPVLQTTCAFTRTDATPVGCIITATAYCCSSARRRSRSLLWSPQQQSGVVRATLAQMTPPMSIMGRSWQACFDASCWLDGAPDSGRWSLNMCSAEDVA